MSSIASDVRLVDSDRGALLSVRIIPRARRSSVDGVRRGALLIRVTAPPVDDAANEAVLRALEDLLSVPRSRLTIATGSRGREKRVLIQGVGSDLVRARLTARLADSA